MVLMEAGFLYHDRVTELPSVETLVCTLQQYRKEKNLAHATRLHTNLCAHGLEAHPELGNYLVPMFVECRSVFDAHRVFHRLVRRKEYSWTSLLQGHVNLDDCELALDLLPNMQNDCVEPSCFTFVALAKACAVMKNMEKGQDIHCEIAKEGFEGDCFLGNTLVDMYAKCGLFAEAWDVLDNLSSQDVVSWNALIAGLADSMLAEDVLKCREQMQSKGIHFNEVTYLSCLKACGSIKALDVGQELHSEIADGKLISHPFVCNALLDMYAKCGHLAEAEDVFDAMATHDIVSWTALVAGYAEQGLGDEALKCLNKMLAENVPPNTVTFIYFLKASGSIMGASRGRDTHREIVLRGFEDDGLIISSLVDMYAKFGSAVEAQKVFDDSPVRDIVTWNAIISANAEQGVGKQGLECFKKLQLEGISPNANTFACSLKACTSKGAITEGQKLHTRILKEGYDSFFVVGSCLVDMYSKCGWLAEAWTEFANLSPVQDIQLWSTLILGYADHGSSAMALWLFALMQEQGLLPDNGIFASMIKVCSKTAALDLGKKFHAQVLKSNLFDDVTGIALVDMYSRCGGLAENYSTTDIQSSMDTVKWTAFITSYAREGETDLALASFEQMRKEGVDPNEITFLSVLSTCTHAGLVQKGQTYYDIMRKDYGISPTIKHFNCMLDLYIRAGQLDDAVAILEDMSVEFDHVTWNILLGACKEWGDVQLARKAFNCALKLQDKHATPFIMMQNILADPQMQKASKDPIVLQD